jgi:hypothetical protein
MSQPEATPPSGNDTFQERLDSLSTTIAQLPAIEIETPAEPPRSKRAYWIVAVLCALSVGAAEVGIVARDPTSDMATPPAAVVEAFENDPCAQRVAAIMNALAAYNTDHGSPPPALAALHPQYLPFVPIDPATNQPYGYEVIGGSVSVSCPRVVPAASEPERAAPDV